jgi:hypothetical protein
MSDEQLAQASSQPMSGCGPHWHVEDGVLRFDGHGDNLCTARDFGDFELLVDWKIPPKGDSGIYLRGSPQVQMLDNPFGSGGLYNNQKHPEQAAGGGRPQAGRMEHLPHPHGGREGDGVAQ